MHRRFRGQHNDMDRTRGVDKKPPSSNEQAREEELRVTDRRRIRLDGEAGGTATAPAEESNLKPAYVEELEARTKAAEKLCGVQSRFEQLRAQLQRETDETRQR